MGAHLAGEHDLLQLPGADALDSSLDGMFVVRRRRRAGDLRALHRIRVDQRHGGRLELRRALERAVEPVGAVVVHDDRDGHPRLAAVARERQLWQHERAGRQRGPLRGRAAVICEGEATHEHGTGGSRAVGVEPRIVGHGTAGKVAHPHADLAKAAGTARFQRGRAAQPRQHEAVTVGLLEAEEAVVGTATRSTAADRSRSAGTGTVTAASTGARAERARSIAVSTR